MDRRRQVAASIATRLADAERTGRLAWTAVGALAVLEVLVALALLASALVAAAQLGLMARRANASARAATIAVVMFIFSESVPATMLTTNSPVSSTKASE